MNSNPVSTVLICVACLAIVAFVGIYITEHVTCWHIPYITNGCVVSK